MRNSSRTMNCQKDGLLFNSLESPIDLMRKLQGAYSHNGLASAAGGAFANVIGRLSGPIAIYLHPRGLLDPDERRDSHLALHREASVLECPLRLKTRAAGSFQSLALQEKTGFTTSSPSAIARPVP